MVDESISYYIDMANNGKNYHINSNKIAKDYDKFFLIQYMAAKRQYSDYPAFIEENCIKTIINGDNLPVLIIFQGFFEKHISDYFSSDAKLSNLENLHKTKLDYAFSGFVKSHEEFNYILVKDNFQSWYFVNLDNYLSAISRILLELNPGKITTVGFSAGGFAAILFGHLFSADSSIAYSPQILTFYHYNNKYRQALNAKYGLSLISLSDLSFVQYYSRGFNTRVYISVATENIVDNEHLNMLELKNYEDVDVTYVKGSDHNIFAMVNKEEEFARVASIASPADK